MKVWRLERNNVGVFHSSILSAMPSCMTEGYRKGNPWAHPTPSQEGLKFNKAWFCGFSSLAQYRLWFNTREQRAFLTRQGVVLKQYEVDPCHVQRGKAQTIFRKAYAKHVASRKPCAI